MTKRTAGIHHITAFVSNAQANADFYAGVLGLRLVKKTINFDAPEVYHLYFGNEVGEIMAQRSHFSRLKVAGKAVSVVGKLDIRHLLFRRMLLLFWEERLTRFSIPFERSERFNETYVQFADPDGLQLEIVAREQGPNRQMVFRRECQQIKQLRASEVLCYTAWLQTRR